MNWKLAITILAIPLVVGCNHDANESTSSNEILATKSREDSRHTEMPPSEDPFADLDEDLFGDLGEDTPRSETPPGDIPLPWTEEELREWSNPSSEWQTVDTTVDFQTGNLVPCPDGLAEFVLEIKAMSKGNCFYLRRQTFCRYDETTPDPSDEGGMSREFLLCGMLINGFVSGSYQYLDLANESVTVKVAWKVSQGENSQEFAAEMTATCRKSGKVDAGGGNSLEWSFMPPS